MAMLTSDSSARGDSRDSSVDASTLLSSNDVSPKHTALLETEVESLNKLLASVSDEAARNALRNNWRKLVKGNDKDHSFLIRAILKYSNERVFVRLVEAYGEQLIKAASNEFLDLAIAARLKTIAAKELVLMLAKADRLGYEEQDVVDEEDEDVVPLEKRLSEDASQGANRVTGPKSNGDTVMEDRTDALLDEQTRVAKVIPIAAAATQPEPSRPVELPSRPIANSSAPRRFVCHDCNATFAQSGGLQYHVDRKVCHRPPPPSKYFCRFCNKGFTTPGGKLYHEQNKVCQNHDTAKATALSPHLQEQVVLRSSPRQLPPPLPSNGPVAIQSYPTSHPQASGSYSSPIYETGPAKLAPRMSPNYPEFRHNNGPPSQTPTRPSSAPVQSTVDVPILDAAAKVDLERRLAVEVARFEAKCREIPDTLTAAEREEEINKQKRGHATRKSQIRKKFGIQVRTSKLRPANFARIPSGDTSPRLEPISRIHAFRAPPVAMTPTFALTAPASVDPVPHERGRLAPPLQGPEAKRRRLSNDSEDPFSRPTSSSSQRRTDSYGVSEELRRGASLPSDGNANLSASPEVDDLKNSEMLVVVEVPGAVMSTNDTKTVPAQAVQNKWEALQPSKPIVTLPRLAAMSNSPISPLNSKERGVAIANKFKEPAVVLDDSDSDSNPDEDIPARIPSYRSRMNTASLPGTPSPGSTMPISPPSAKRTGKRTGPVHFPGRLGGSDSKLRSPVEV